VHALPRTMIPQRVTVLRAFPLGPNGKIDRRALAELIDA
jgi:non-ribosomal peptide synthetase component E (peptide arylation enzyme)